MIHFEDREYTCARCKKKVTIPHNKVGGFWWLTNYETTDGVKHFGGHCPECFDEIYARRV